MSSYPGCRDCGDDLTSQEEQEQRLCHGCQVSQPNQAQLEKQKYDLRTQKQLEDLKAMRGASRIKY